MGRTDELGRLGALITAARNGASGALMVRGEPGIGKSTVVRAATDALDGVRLVRADGYESESSLAYAGLQRLGASLREYAPALPPQQRTALRVAAGMQDGPPPDRFLVGLGMLSLFAAAGADSPVVCVVDDAHWLDPESLEVLAFVARRLHAESTVLLVAARDDAVVDAVTSGIPTLRVEGLGTVDAVDLLNRTLTGTLDSLVAAQVAGETGGNPLAIVDLAHELTARELTDSSWSPLPTPVGARLEAHYMQQVRATPPDVQLWLLVAAAESTGDPDLVARACTRLGLAPDAGPGAERAGLVAVDGSVRFRHPLVRAAVYGAMAGPERRRVHAALAAESDLAGRSDLAVWHAAAATVGSDAAVAGRLERAADDAGRRGGLASRARLLARSADLTPAGRTRTERLVAAAEAATGAGAAHLALDLLDRVDPEHLDAVGRGRSISTRALLAGFIGDPAGVVTAPADMLRAADEFHGRAPVREQHALVRAFEYALQAEGQMAGVTLDGLGRRMAAGADVADGPLAVALRALSAHVLLPYPQAVPLMRAGVDLIESTPDEHLLDLGYFGVALTMGLWDERACVVWLERTARVARDAGSLRMLDATLWLLSLVELVRGDPASSGRYVEQVRELRRAIGYPAEHVVNAAYLAWTGAPREQVEQVATMLRGTGYEGAWTVAMTGLAVREIAEGRYHDAYDRLAPIVARPFLQVTYQQLPELVEAAARSGHLAQARAAADRLGALTQVAGTPWGLGLHARSEALLADDAAAEQHHRAAVRWLRQATAPADLGRAHLVYGEWLRRVRRRADARRELRAALAVFTRVDAPAFAARTSAELEATGEHVASGGSATVDLTPREAAIAQMAAGGATNAEIGAALFISVNTVDYHLRKVFRKLGATSRRQLAERLAAR